MKDESPAIGIHPSSLILHPSSFILFFPGGSSMEAILGMLLTVAALAAVVLGFRLVLRRPRGVSSDDPPDVRTVAIFAGSDPEFFRDDRPERPYVGVRLFEMLCGGLAACGFRVERRRHVQNAQGADCIVGVRPFTLVLEWVEEELAKRWVLGVDWCPLKGAERRHLAVTRQVFSPPDSPELRQLLTAIDGWLKKQPRLSDIGWHRKQDWLVESTTDPAPVPVNEEGSGARG